MNANRNQRRLFLAAACLMLSGGCFGDGCISGEVLNYGRYDRATYSFMLMQCDVNIAARNDAQFDWIADLWARRTNLIINPTHQIPFLSGPAAAMIERRGKHSLREIPIGEKPATEPAEVETAVALDTIQVTPGEFFLNEYGNLCYSHETLIPGATLDASIREITPVIARGLVELAEQQRRVSGERESKPETWDDLREAILESLGEKDAKPAGDRAKNQGSLPLDSDSLRLMTQAVADGSVRFTRNADAFTLVIPLSRRDCDEAVATVKLARNVVEQRRKWGREVKQGLAEWLNVFEIRSQEGAGLSLTIGLGKLDEIASQVASPMPPEDPNRKWMYQATIAAIQKRGIAVNKSDLFPMVLKRHNRANNVP